MNANSGTLNNVTINQNCRILGKLSANQIEGDIVKTVGKAFPRNGSYASGTITVTVYDDQAFDRQIVVPPFCFVGVSMKTSTATTNSHTGIQPVSCRY